MVCWISFTNISVLPGPSKHVHKWFEPCKWSASGERACQKSFCQDVAKVSSCQCCCLLFSIAYATALAYISRSLPPRPRLIKNDMIFIPVLHEERVALFPPSAFTTRLKIKSKQMILNYTAITGCQNSKTYL